MERLIEEKFVKTFVIQNMQERIAFELMNTDKLKRDKALTRFANWKGIYLKGDCIILANKQATIDVIEREVEKKVKGNSKCYLIGSAHDGEVMTLRKALEICFDWLGTSIIVVGETLAFIKTETCVGPPMKFILSKQKDNEQQIGVAVEHKVLCFQAKARLHLCTAQTACVHKKQRAVLPPSTFGTAINYTAKNAEAHGLSTTTMLQVYGA